MNLGLIYNSELRNNGTPAHFWHAFRELGTDFRRYYPQGELPKHDFYLWIDDGRDDIRWLPPHPWGFYATDTHLGWDYRFWKAQQADIVWCAQKPAAEKMKAAGLNAYWLPLACNPMAHPTAEELQKRLKIPIPEKKYDWAFVGHLQPPKDSNRIEFLDALCSAFPKFRLAFGVFHEEAALVYHQARIGVNHAVRDDLNMRFFELASMGMPQLCDRRMKGLGELGFQEDSGMLDGAYLGYESTEEAVSVLKNSSERELEYSLAIISEKALALVRSRHTYAHRCQTILSNIHDFHAVAV